jgi:small GTP-binding protein
VGSIWATVGSIWHIIEYKIVVVGSILVGKSSLVSMYTRSHFESDYIPTIEDTYRKNISVDGEDCLLEIVDTSGDPLFSTVIEYQMRKGDGFLCVFALNDLDSFEKVCDYIKKIRLVKNNQATPMLLIGNKCDEKREIDLTQAQLHARFLDVPYFETSAKLNMCINESFFNLVVLMRLMKNSLEAAAAETKHCCVVC